MEFNPQNKIVQLCLKGIVLRENNQWDQANTQFNLAWEEATHPFEKFLTTYFIALGKTNSTEKLEGLLKALSLAMEINNQATISTFQTLYKQIALCFEAMNDFKNAEKYAALSASSGLKITDKGPFYHGTKAQLQIGDYLKAGENSNYKDSLVMNHIYFTALINGAGLAASLAKGDGEERVYIVEPTGQFENDPNVTDKKFPGNLTRSYRSEAPLKITGEVKDWSKQSLENIQEWKDKLAKNTGEIIN